MQKTYDNNNKIGLISKACMVNVDLNWETVTNANYNYLLWLFLL